MPRVNIKAAIEQVDLVEYAEKYTALSESGSQYRGICPICKHGNETEFVVYNHKSFYCFVSGRLLYGSREAGGRVEYRHSAG